MPLDTSEYYQKTIKCDRHLQEVSGIADKVVISVSSGKTSTYLALNKNPEDKRPYHYQFAVVLSSDPNAKPKDKGLLKEAQARIPWFEASHEVDESLRVILKLEQELGQKIRWVASPLTLEELIEEKKALPDRTKRFCTKGLKYEPQFWDAYLNLGEGLKTEDYFIPNPFTIEVQVGIRWDERQRVYRALGVEGQLKNCDAFEYSYCCDLNGKFAKKHRWVKADWRVRTFPLYSDRITNYHIYQYWEKRNWDYIFPKNSNCVFCFNKNKQELQEQAAFYPERLPGWLAQESKIGRTFNKKAGLKQIIFEDVLLDSKPLSCACTD